MFRNCLERVHQIGPPLKDEENDLEEKIGPLAAEVVVTDILAQQVA